MPYNGSGVFNPLAAPNSPAVAGTTIISAYYNAVIQDLIAGLTTCVTRNGQSVWTANLPAGGYKITGLGAGTAAGDSVSYGQAVVQFGEVRIDNNFTAAISGGTLARLTFDVNDYLQFDRANNQYQLFIGGAQVLIVQTDGRVTSAVAAANGADLMRKNEVDSLITTVSTAVGTAQSTANGAVSTINNFLNRLVGSIIPFAVGAVPAGYLECAGQAVSRTTYSQLFALIGVIYGNGDGATTFNLPDYRGQFLRGWDHGAGIDPDAATRTNRGDGTTGDNVGTRQSHAVQQHTHNTFIPTWDATASRDQDPPYATDSPGTITASGGVNGTNISSETRPVNRYVMFCIFANA